MTCIAGVPPGGNAVLPVAVSPHHRGDDREQLPLRPLEDDLHLSLRWGVGVVAVAGELDRAARNPAAR